MDYSRKIAPLLHISAAKVHIVRATDFPPREGVSHGRSGQSPLPSSLLAPYRVGESMPPCWNTLALLRAFPVFRRPARSRWTVGHSILRVDDRLVEESRATGRVAAYKLVRPAMTLCQHLLWLQQSASPPPSGLQSAESSGPNSYYDG